MCGIVGFVSRENQSSAILIDGLKSLEYRGYDSCGLVLVGDNGVILSKAKGKVSELEKKIDASDKGYCGIGHTRWATHGEPSVVNAHPHKIESVTLVHNGIIENSDILRRVYQEKGIVFTSQTDTEVACAVISDCVKNADNKVEAIRNACAIMEGSYAFAIIFQDELNHVYAIRKDNPLILGVSEDTFYLASDCSAFLSYTNQIIELEENEIAILKQDGITVLNEQNEVVNKEVETSLLSFEEIQKDGFDTFLMKEIYEEPSVIQKTIHHYMASSLDDLMDTMEDLSKYNRFVFVGCGSAYHAGMVASSLMERKARISSTCELASEFRYKHPILDKQTAVVFISQSGETADTLAALRMCNEMGIDTFAIVNVLGSSLAKEAKVFMPTLAGKEISVATTKAYCAQVAVLSLMALKKAMQEELLSAIEKVEIEEEIERLPALMKKTIETCELENVVEMIGNHQNCFFMGRGLDYSLSLEASLKLKEISYIHSEAYAAGELKHGTISLIEEGTPVIAMISDPSLASKTMSNIKEVQTRGAKVTLLIREDLIEDSLSVDTIIKLPEVHSTMQAILSILPTQLLAYEVAKKRGCDIDQPRNLAKSVTVE